MSDHPKFDEFSQQFKALSETLSDTIEEMEALAQRRAKYENDEGSCHCVSETLDDFKPILEGLEVTLDVYGRSIGMMVQKWMSHDARVEFHRQLNEAMRSQRQEEDSVAKWELN